MYIISFQKDFNGEDRRQFPRWPSKDTIKDQSQQFEDGLNKPCKNF